MPSHISSDLDNRKVIPFDKLPSSGSKINKLRARAAEYNIVQNCDGEPFTRIPMYLIRDCRLSTTGKTVYMVIASFAYGKKSVAFPSQASIAEYACCTPKTVRAAIKELVELGYIEKFQVSRQSPFIYRLTKPKTELGKNYPTEMGKNDLTECGKNYPLIKQSEEIQI